MSPGAPVLGCPIHLPGAWDDITARHHPKPGLAHHSEALPGAAHLRVLATGSQGWLGQQGTTTGLSPTFVPVVQGSSGHQLWTPGSIRVEETV